MFPRAPLHRTVNNLEAKFTTRTFITATTKVGRMSVTRCLNFSNPHTVSFKIHFIPLPLLICCFWIQCYNVLPNIHNCIHYSPQRDTAGNKCSVHVHRNILLYIFLSHYYYWRVFCFSESSVKIFYPWVLTATNNPCYNYFNFRVQRNFLQYIYIFIPLLLLMYASIPWIDFKDILLEGS
jgi:hypothetical protein